MIIPETSNYARRFGWVIGVGPDVRDLAFGDVIEISPRGSETSIFFFHPLQNIGGDPSPDARYLAQDGAGQGMIELEGRCLWVFMPPEDVLYRICRGNEMGTAAAGVHPVADRVLVRHCEPDGCNGPIHVVRGMTRNYGDLGQVIEAGADVQSVAVGDWVGLPPTSGTHFKASLADGAQYTIIRERDILLSWSKDAKPCDFQAIFRPGSTHSRGDMEAETQDKVAWAIRSLTDTSKKYFT